MRGRRKERERGRDREREEGRERERGKWKEGWRKAVMQRVTREMEREK